MFDKVWVTYFFFSLPELKDEVSLTDHLSSVARLSVRKLFTFPSSSEPLGLKGLKLVQMKTHALVQAPEPLG